MRRALGFTLAIGISVTGAVAVAAPGTASAQARPALATTRTTVPVTAGTLTWAKCKSSDLRANGEVCAHLAVPLDYSDPTGTKVHLALAMVKHTVAAANYQGIMLVNPGGPGASGLGLATVGGDLPSDAGAAYDWIAWDPRGVGASTPNLHCDSKILAGPRPSYTPDTAKLTSYWQHKSKAYAHACRVHGGALIHHVTTADSARDMESIRIATGQDQLNYYGYSYGTYLGEVYSTRYPDRVRREVFDSTVNPSGVWYGDNLAQDPAFETTMKAWFSWIAQHNHTFELGAHESTVAARFSDLKAKLRAHPAGKVVGPDEWKDIFLGAGYYQSTWVELGSLLSSWYHDKSNTVGWLVDEYRSAEGIGNDNGYAMYLAVECTDSAWPQHWSTWKKDNDRVAKTAPFLTWPNAMYNLPCLYWPAAPHKTVTIDGTATTSLLLVDQTLDGATPYEGSLAVRDLFPHSSLIAVPGGTSHAVTPEGNACVDNQIAAYLDDGTLPTRVAGRMADTTCAPLPKPSPDALPDKAPDTAPDAFSSALWQHPVHDRTRT